MPGTQLFPRHRRSPARVLIPDTRNEAGGAAFLLNPEQTLAVYAATGMLGTTAYATGQDQVETIQALAERVPVEFLARVAVYARDKAYLKDTPALLLAVLLTRDPALFRKVAPRVLDRGRMIRNFVQIIRSGRVGRRSLAGNGAATAVLQQWFAHETDLGLFYASIGEQGVSLADVIRLVRPSPRHIIGTRTMGDVVEQIARREALYGYFIGKVPGTDPRLPDVIARYERLKLRAQDGEFTPSSDAIRGLPFEKLIALPLSAEGWLNVAIGASYIQTLKNLNTFARHGVFTAEGTADPLTGRSVVSIARRLMDPDLIRISKVFPYQILTAIRELNADVPKEVRYALEAALETAIANVPVLPGNLAIFLDCSGSMLHPVSGVRQGATTAMRNIDAAAVLVAALLRQNPMARLITYNDHAREVRLAKRESSLSALTAELSALVESRGTHIAAAFECLLLHLSPVPDLIIVVSDNQSWMEGQTGSGSLTMQHWRLVQHKNPATKLAFLDVAPVGSAPVRDDEHVINIGGFSDQVFTVLAAFAEYGATGNTWVDLIRRVAVD